MVWTHAWVVGACVRACVQWQVSSLALSPSLLSHLSDAASSSRLLQVRAAKSIPSTLTSSISSVCVTYSFSPLSTPQIA